MAGMGKIGALAILSKLSPSKKDDDKDDGEEEWLTVSSELLKAIRSGTEKEFADCLKACFECYENKDHGDSSY